MKIILAGVTLVAGYLLLGPSSLVLAAIFLLLSHFGHHRAALIAVLTAFTMPAFYAHGDGWAKTASSAIAASALAFAALGTGRKGTRMTAAAGGLAAAAFGFFHGGSPFESALPPLSVGLAWVLTRPDRNRARALLCAAALLLLLVLATISPSPSTLERLGATPSGVTQTFDVATVQIARELYPWSALLPFALAGMTALPPPPKLGATPAQIERQSALRILLLTAAVLSHVASQLPWDPATPAPHSILVFGAAAIGLWLEDISRGARVAAPSMLAVAALAALIGLDFLRFPETRASVFAPRAPPDVLAKLTALEASPPLPLSAAVALPAASALAGCLWQRGGFSTAALLGTVLSAIILRCVYYPETPARLDHREISAKFLDSVLIENVPAGTRPLDAEFGGRVRALGWELLDDRGIQLERVSAHTRFRVRLYYQVERGELAGHCTFLHIDHRPTRFAAEHGWNAYPTSLWRTGDRLADEFDVELPVHFVVGDYPIHFGFGVLPCRDERRLPVTRGAHDQHRARVGTLAVR